MEKKKEVAAALRYEQSKDGAPVIVAVGRGDLAGKIKEIAQAKGIPVYKNEVLAETLVRLGAGVEIPEEIYETVARIIAYIYLLDKKVEASGKNEHPSDQGKERFSNGR